MNNVLPVVEKGLASELHRIVDETLENNDVSLSVTGRAYVVGLLVSVSRSERLFRDPNIPDYGIETIGQTYMEKREPRQLKALGDRCLVLFGLFSESLEAKGRAFLNYYQDVGSASYFDVGRHFRQAGVSMGDLFLELGSRFVDVGRAMHDVGTLQLSNNALLYRHLQRRLAQGDQVAAIQYAESLVRQFDETSH
jgi:hypothetical protein